MDILDEVKRLIDTDRKAEYGPVEENYQCVADLWNGYLNGGRDSEDSVDEPIEAFDCLIMMALLKIARVSTGKLKRDTLGDAIGYLALAAQVRDLRFSEPITGKDAQTWVKAEACFDLPFVPYEPEK